MVDVPSLLLSVHPDALCPSTLSADQPWTTPRSGRLPSFTVSKVFGNCSFTTLGTAGAPELLEANSLGWGPGLSLPPTKTSEYEVPGWGTRQIVNKYLLTYSTRQEMEDGWF